MTVRSGRTRMLTTVGAAALAVAGVAALGVGRHESPAAEPRLTSPPAAATTAATGAAAARGDVVLTTGRLLPTSPPIRVAIPALQVSVPVVGLGLQPDGSMAVPTDARTVGWYTKAPTPGSLGPAVLAGHVNYHGADGTFARLATLKAGGQVQATRPHGAGAVFAVTHVDRYA